jgi:hypothetical protein
MAFSDAVRHELCIEADGWCSAPDCRVRTGYFVKSESIAAGDGAHIVAESYYGPRGNSPLTPEQRSFAQNGLWLCPTCHRKVDLIYPGNYDVEMLSMWKQQAKGLAIQMRGLPYPQAYSREDLMGASAFFKLHEPLANQLRALIFNTVPMFRSSIAIPEKLEILMRVLSDRLTAGRSWQHEWGTTYLCSNPGIKAKMQELVRCISLPALGGQPFTFRPPQNQWIINFEAKLSTGGPADNAACGILGYLEAYDSLNKFLTEHLYYPAASHRAY